jgi:hypothetical protein
MRHPECERRDVSPPVVRVSTGGLTSRRLGPFRQNGPTFAVTQPANPYVE